MTLNIHQNQQRPQVTGNRANTSQTNNAFNANAFHESMFSGQGQPDIQLILSQLLPILQQLVSRMNQGHTISQALETPIAVPVSAMPMAPMADHAMAQAAAMPMDHTAMMMPMAPAAPTAGPAALPATPMAPMAAAPAAAMPMDHTAMMMPMAPAAPAPAMPMAPMPVAPAPAMAPMAAAPAAPAAMPMDHAEMVMPMAPAVAAPAAPAPTMAPMAAAPAAPAAMPMAPAAAGPGMSMAPMAAALAAPAAPTAKAPMAVAPVKPGHEGHNHAVAAKPAKAGPAAPATAAKPAQTGAAAPVTAAKPAQAGAAAPATAAKPAATIQPGHDFYSHVNMMYPKAVAPGEAPFGGYAWANENTIVGRNPITGLQPVIEQAINDITKVAANKNLPINELESKVAERLTQLNDWGALTKETQGKLVELTGVDFGKMTAAEREKSINHLLHSPQPFGAIEQPLSPNMRIDLNYTHTLDKSKTTVADLGNGLFNVNLLSNNNNGSHTGHSLGSFNIQLAPGMTAKQAKEMANDMVNDTADNTQLYLSEAARQQLAAVMELPIGPNLQQTGAAYSATGEFQANQLQNFDPGANGAAHAGHAPQVGADGKVLPGHDFVTHVKTLYPDALAKGQSQYGGYAWVNNTTLAARSSITGLQPVIDQAISDVMKVAANKNLPLSKLEPKVAERLTQLNDWTALTKGTQAALVKATGVDFGKMTAAEQEKSINHLLHSPLPFGDIQQVLRPDMRVDLGYTHTLDKTKTLVKDTGNGVFNITLISNNNNGSHTGHNLGSFNLQLAPGMSATQAKNLANKMVTNTNNNKELYLSEVARQQLAAYLD